MDENNYDTEFSYGSRHGGTSSASCRRTVVLVEKH
ncbi:uncharacterized protein METZ01_LOCUS376032 [marine metagenome]|uniref:Uncharacterized protein n=1 Tax=marine metagenome TaxID=408172 RepID=A0A382TP00_9ZZZZ